mmetsp:Transcript_51894/g.161001  ORF Transcript_51894/g.161001 Transcript_51894/m.161001 type:complete len:278 (-) Transcript_51894:109-942(-)
MSSFANPHLLRAPSTLLSAFDVTALKAQQASETLVSIRKSGAPASDRPVDASASSRGASSKRCRPGTLQWTQRLSQMARSPARTRTTRGRNEEFLPKRGSVRGMTKKSFSRLRGHRSKMSLWRLCDPGKTASPPVESSWSVKATKPWAHSNPLPVVQPFWSVWNHPPLVLQPGSMAVGRKAQAPSKLTTSSDGSRSPQMSAKARSTAGRVRTNHMKGAWPTPGAPRRPLEGCPGQAGRPQVSGFSRRTCPCVLSSRNSQNKSVAVCTWLLPCGFNTA